MFCIITQANGQICSSCQATCKKIAGTHQILINQTILWTLTSRKKKERFLEVSWTVNVIEMTSSFEYSSDINDVLSRAFRQHGDRWDSNKIETFFSLIEQVSKTHREGIRSYLAGDESFIANLDPQTDVSKAYKDQKKCASSAHIVMIAENLRIANILN